MYQSYGAVESIKLYEVFKCLHFQVVLLFKNQSAHIENTHAWTLHLALWNIKQWTTTTTTTEH